MEERRRALLARLRDGDDQVRGRAAQALDRLDVSGALPGESRTVATRDRVAAVTLLRSLAGLRGELVLKTALQALEHPDPDVRLAALERVEEIRDWRATTHAVRRLDDADPVVRARAAEVLGRLGDGRAAEAVGQRLADPDPRVVTCAAEALGLLGHAPAELRLLTLATHPNPEIRAAATEALGRLPPRSP